MKWRNGLLFGLLALALAPAAAADAATLYVDDDAPAGNVDCTQAAPCNTVTKAVEEARTIDGPDAIQVAAGEYTERVVVNNPVMDQGLTITGAGPTTVIRHPGGGPADAALQLGGVIVPPPTGLTAANLRVEVPAGVVKPAVRVSGNGATLRDVQVDMLEPTNFYSGLSLSDPTLQGVTVERVDIGGAWVGSGIFSQADGLRLRDTVVETNEARTMDISGEDIRIERARLAMGGEDPIMMADGAQAVISSSLLTGGDAGISAYQSALTLRGVTIDAGMAGLSDDSVTGIRVYGDPGNTSTATLDSSIVLEPFNAATNGIGSITCTSSDVSDQTEAPGGDDTVACGAAAGNVTTPPSQLFAAPGDWHLAAGSPAIDSGSAAPPAAEESATDLDGNPRALDGNLDCAAVRDKGAYEVTGRECTPAPPLPDTEAPVVSGLSMTNRRFRVGRPAAAQRRRRAPRGTRFRYRLNEQADVVLTIERLLPGRRVAGKCRKPTRRNRTRRRCKRFKRSGRLTHNGGIGPNSLAFSGRIGRRKLRPGRYRATLVATDRAGNASAPRRLGFRIVRR